MADYKGMYYLKRKLSLKRVRVDLLPAQEQKETRTSLLELLEKSKEDE